MSGKQQDLNDARSGWESATEQLNEVCEQRDELLDALKAIRGGEIQPATVAMFAADVIAKAES